MMLKRARFLVLRGGAIGDFIVTLPVLQALREHWPAAEIELIGYPHVAELAREAGLVDRVDSLDKAGMARFFAAIPSFSPEQASYIESFDIILSFLHDPHGVVADNLRAAGARQVIYASPMVTSGHAVDHLIKPLETLAIYAAGAVPRLRLSDGTRARGRRLLEERGVTGRVVAIHPGSGSPAKNWSADRFIALARRLRTEGAAVVCVLGEADAEVRTRVVAELPEVPRIEQVRLVELAGALSCCAAYVGNDSGITHLASAVGVPVVALYGPSDADRWGPRGEHVQILRAPGGDLAALSVDDVLAACLRRM